MCGIFGYFNRDGSDLSPDVAQQMGDALRHRGPDDSGVFRESGVMLGNQRLSIIDVGGGHQPFVSDDGNIVVVQNGEILSLQDQEMIFGQINYWEGPMEVVASIDNKKIKGLLVSKNFNEFSKI